jgi:hypothetical protein
MSLFDLSVNERVRDGAIRFVIKGSITCELIMESRRTLLKYLKIHRVSLLNGPLSFITRQFLLIAPQLE